MVQNKGVGKTPSDFNGNKHFFPSLIVHDKVLKNNLIILSGEQRFNMLSRIAAKMKQGKFLYKGIVEEWRTVHGYENYMVSNFGRVKSLNYRRSGQEGIMAPVPNSKGYLTLLLTYNRVQKGHSVHKLVAQAFLDKPTSSGLYYVIHKDRDKTNNRVDNLEYVLPGDTGKYSHVCPNNKSRTRKFSAETEVKIKEEYLQGNVSQSFLAQKYGTSQKHIFSICKRN